MAAQNDTPPETENGPITGQNTTAGKSEESKPILIPTPNSPKNGPKIETPLPPILQTNKNADREELEKRKILQQNYVVKLSENLISNKKALKKSEDYAANLEKAYEQAKTAGDTATAQKLTKNISRVKANIKNFHLQKDRLQEYLLEANKRLGEVHEQISRSGGNKKPSALGSASLVTAVGGFLAGNAILNKLRKKKSQHSEFDKKFREAQGERQLRERFGLAQPQVKVPPEEFKEKFNQHLAQQGLSSLGNNNAIPPTAVPKLGSSPLGAIKSLKNIAQTIKNLKTIIKTVKILTTSASGIGAVVNLALLLKDKIAKLRKIIIKAIAAAYALMILFWLWLLAKLAGIFTGAIFGLVTGAPLLLVPGVGPFLYAGWVGYWTWKGWTDPFAVFHLATHPWELITKPLKWVGDKLSGLGGGAKGGVETVAGGIGNTAGGLASTAGSFLTGSASALWGGLTGALGGAVSTAGSVISTVWGALTSAGSTITGNVIPVAVGGSLASVAGVTVVGTIMTNSAFYTQDLDRREQLFPPGQNELFSITKTANPSQIANPDVLSTTSVSFNVRITAKQNLTNLQISDSTTVSNNSSLNITANSCQQANLPLSLNAGANFDCTVNIQVNVEQSDSTISNSATLTASNTSGASTTDTATASIRVGNAPQSCNNFKFVTGDPSIGSPASWTQAEIDTINSICDILLAKSPTLISLINTAQTITLERYLGDCSGAVNGGTIARFFGCNLSNFDSAKYVFIHELGHVIGNVNGSQYQSFLNSGAFEAEGMIKTYPLCPGSVNESFAEMIADYVVAKTYNFPARCTGYPGGPYLTFPADYPLHYNFAKNNIFGGVIY